ncbi:MAG: FMN-binding negative transcriptional regulator [Saprospiraceae bacterium]|nr:FMN-binding negative transcriptional regulator [Saprospiraceae bacterium]
MTHAPVLDIQSVALAADFIRRNPFALLVTTYHNRPVTTHLPVLIKESHGQIKLYSYLAKTNAQWKHLEFEEALVLFRETQVVPLVQDLTETPILPPHQSRSLLVYGDCNIIHDQNRVYELLEMMIKKFEQKSFGKWLASSSDFKESLISSLISFELKVNDLKFQDIACQTNIMQELCS